MKTIIPFCILVLLIQISNGQPFTKITSSTNPIASDLPETYYQGASWVDYDNDGKLDLFVVRKALYHNDGDGNFTKVTTSGINTSSGIGNSWADYDNDGDMDCFISGGDSRGSSLWTNNGNGTFSRNLSGPLSDSLALRAWNCAWGDFNNDGFADIILAAPIGFNGITDNNKFLLNHGDGTFERLDTSIICQSPAPYTIASWSDFDDDGDIDLFIGSGPVNGSLEPDYLYRNELKESGIAYFKQDIPLPLNEPRDGQQWNWIDFDNDGDLDGYVTNYVGTNTANGYPNDFYRNDNGTFVKLTASDVGTIVSDVNTSLANVWEDFDNDADLDCLIINDATEDNEYYQNNWDAGSTVFTKISGLPFLNSNNSNFSAAAGDYDSDGDLDVFISSAGSVKGLYRNDQANGNKWVNIKLVGVISNKSALNAKVRVKAIVNGGAVWQMREVSSQSSFNGMNSLNAEFGLGNAAVIDSIKIEWPSGMVDQYSGVAVNQFYKAVEGESFSVGVHELAHQVTAVFMEAYPNPVSDVCRVRVVPPKTIQCTLTLYDLMGNKMQLLSDGILSAGQHDFIFSADNLAPGIYSCNLESAGAFTTLKICITK